MTGPLVPHVITLAEINAMSNDLGISPEEIVFACTDKSNIEDNPIGIPSLKEGGYVHVGTSAVFIASVMLIGQEKVNKPGVLFILDIAQDPVAQHVV